MLTHFRKIRADKRRWAEAQSLSDACALAALWLDGELVWHPAEGGRTPDEETADLIPVLAAANWAGFLTDQSQPGSDEVIDGEHWVQRAAVQGFIRDRQLLTRIRKIGEDPDLLVMLFRPCGDLWLNETPATFRDGVCVTSFGIEQSAGHLERVWRRIGPAAMAEVVDAWQVAIIDLQDGRNDRLWPALTEALAPDSAPLAPVVPLHRP